MAHIRTVMRFCFELGKLAMRICRWPDDRLFVRAVYRSCLKREPDTDGEAFYLEALRRGSMSRLDVLRSVLESNEFKQIYGLPVHPLNALHQARMMLIRRHLPMAEVVVDLGGAAGDRPEGALLVMGYPYRPSEIIIVDLVLPRLCESLGKTRNG